MADLSVFCHCVAGACAFPVLSLPWMILTFRVCSCRPVGVLVDKHSFSVLGATGALAGLVYHRRINLGAIGAHAHELLLVEITAVSAIIRATLG